MVLESDVSQVANIFAFVLSLAIFGVNARNLSSCHRYSVCYVSGFNLSPFLKLCVHYLLHQIAVHIPVPVFIFGLFLFQFHVVPGTIPLRTCLLHSLWWLF